MKPAVYKKIWKLKVMLGVRLSKISDYEVQCVRIEMFKLRNMISKCQFCDVSAKEVFQTFFRHYHFIDEVYNNVCSKYSIEKREQILVYTKNNKYRFEIDSTEKGKIIVYIPTEMF